MTRRIRGTFQADGGVRPEAFGLGLKGTLGHRGGVDSDGLHIGALTPIAVGSFMMLDASGPTWVDDTTDINDVGAADVLLMPATEASGAEGTGDTANFGHVTKKFTGIKITLSTAGTAGVVAWEYWNGSAWTLLTTAHHLVDDSVEYTTGTSTYFITWAVPTDWAKKTLNLVEAYWVRSRVTTVYTINPVATQAWLLSTRDGMGFYVPVSGHVKRMYYQAGTVSGATDSVFQWINTSSGATALMTLTQALTREQVTLAGAGLTVTRGDFVALQQLISHATALADVSVLIEID